MPSFKMLDNIAYRVKFLYDQPKVWDNTDDQGKAYKTFSYGVEINQKNEYLGVSEPVHNILQSFGPLSARTLEIQKVQDPENLKKKHWVFKENGVELRPSTQSGSNVSNTSQNPVEVKITPNNDILELQQTIANMRTWATETEKRLQGLETLVESLTSKEAKELHQSFTPRDIHESKVEAVAKELGGTVEKEFEFPRKV